MGVFEPISKTTRPALIWQLFGARFLSFYVDSLTRIELRTDKVTTCQIIYRAYIPVMAGFYQKINTCQLKMAFYYTEIGRLLVGKPFISNECEEWDIES